jgi:hypothetical protein
LLLQLGCTLPLHKTSSQQLQLKHQLHSSMEAAAGHNHNYGHLRQANFPCACIGLPGASCPGNGEGFAAVTFA